MIFAVQPVKKVVFDIFLTTFFVSKSNTITEKSSRATARRELERKLGEREEWRNGERERERKGMVGGERGREGEVGR